MSSIGNFSFLSMTGRRPPGFVRGVEIIDDPQVDGVGWVSTALKNIAIEKRTVAGFATMALAEQMENHYAALINLYVTLVEGNGVIWNNVFVEAVDVLEVRPVSGSSEPGVNYLVEAVWRVRRSV